jgi:hypothetical protein
MRRLVFSICVACVCAQSALATITVTSSQAQVLTDGMINPSMLITGATPWDFTSTSYLSLTSIDEISVTLTLFEGDTGAGINDFDQGQLMLQLDGLNTGLALDGFDNDLTVTHTVTGPNLHAGILSALQIDGYLLGSILDLSPNDNYVKVRDGYYATLTLTDHEASVVPVPGAMLLAGLGVAGAGWLKRKRYIKS